MLTPEVARLVAETKLISTKHNEIRCFGKCINGGDCSKPVNEHDLVRGLMFLHLLASDEHIVGKELEERLGHVVVRLICVLHRKKDEQIQNGVKVARQGIERFRSLRTHSHASVVSMKIDDNDNETESLRQAVAEASEVVADQEEELESRQQELDAAMERITLLEQEVQAKEKEVQAKEKEVQAKETTNECLRATLVDIALKKSVGGDEKQDVSVASSGDEGTKQEPTRGLATRGHLGARAKPTGTSAGRGGLKMFGGEEAESKAEGRWKGKARVSASEGSATEVDDDDIGASPSKWEKVKTESPASTKTPVPFGFMVRGKRNAGL